MCSNSNYRSYAIDPDDWDKHLVVKPKAKETCKKRYQEQSDTTGIDSSLVKSDESFNAYNRISIGTKSW